MVLKASAELHLLASARVLVCRDSHAPQLRFALGLERHRDTLPLNQVLKARVQLPGEQLAVKQVGMPRTRALCTGSPAQHSLMLMDSSSW